MNENKPRPESLNEDTRNEPVKHEEMANKENEIHTERTENIEDDDSLDDFLDIGGGMSTGGGADAS